MLLRRVLEYANAEIEGENDFCSDGMSFLWVLSSPREVF